LFTVWETIVEVFGGIWRCIEVKWKGQAGSKLVTPDDGQSRVSVGTGAAEQTTGLRLL
jgi:hypothetical protein